MNTDFNNACGCSSNFVGVDGSQAKNVGRDILDTVQSGAEDIFDVVKSTGGFVIEEAKEGIDEIQEQGQKVDEKNRLIKAIPNSYLVFGAVGILLYSLIK